MAIRINKYLTSIGYCSRREADTLIEEGVVKINGETATLGDKIEEGDDVFVRGERVNKTVKPIYLLLNKPKGITSTTDQNDPTNMIDYINYPDRIFPVGRLDKDSEGLILLTNDGDIVNKILRSGNAHEKEYLVTVNKPITSHFLQQMRQGVPILETVTKPAKVKQQNKHQFRIILQEGLNRQIRRMCSKLGYRVTRLIRNRIMHITDHGLERGKWRELTTQELSTLLEQVEHSSKTEEASR